MEYEGALDSGHFVDYLDEIKLGRLRAIVIRVGCVKPAGQPSSIRHYQKLKCCLKSIVNTVGISTLFSSIFGQSFEDLFILDNLPLDLLLIYEELFLRKLSFSPRKKSGI